MELPKSIIKAERKDPARLIIYSSPKVGKTTSLSQLKDCLIIDLENGSNFVDALKIKVGSLKELYEVGEEIKKQGKPYKYVAIDTATKLEEWCEEDAKRLYLETPMGANFKGRSVLMLPNGGGYLYLRNSFTKWLNYLSTLSDRVIFTAHLKEKFIANKKGEEVSAKDIDLTGKIRNIICAEADAIGYMYRDKESHLKVSFVSDDEVMCGTRCEHLKGADIEFNWDKIFID